MKTINHILIHCSGTNQEMSVIQLQRYWRLDKNIAIPVCHYVIEKDGLTVQLASDEHFTNMNKGCKSHSIHICYIGGINNKAKPVDNRTSVQCNSLFELLVLLSLKYPKARISGYRDLAGNDSTSPNFDVQQWWKDYVPSYRLPMAA